MEEIDTIIIDSLRNLHCDIDEDITSLKQFDPDLTLTSISTCIETILGDIKLPKKFPPSMAIKLKIATTISEQIKNLGFRDDIGYQTILYSNETEIRRVLMFLIERLPRETNHKIIRIEETGYVPQLCKEIQRKIQQSFEQFWLPSNVLSRGCRKINNSTYLVHNFGDSIGIKSKKLKIPKRQHDTQECFKQYWNRNVPEVTKQCQRDELISSLLFNDFVITTRQQFVNDTQINESVDFDNSQLINEIQIENPPLENRVEIVENNDNTLERLIDDFKMKQTELSQLQQTLRDNEIRLSQMNQMKGDEEKVLKDTQTKIDLKTKTLSILHKEDNLTKLRNLIENNNNKLIHLANQWKEIQTPLLKEYKSLQSSLLDNDLKIQEQNKLKKLGENYTTLTNDLKEKTVLEEQLRRQLESINRKQNRSNYTRRILEIISNIKKQDNEIDKILKDTRNVQKEINILTGQVDRSFTLSDEIIFRDAKQDETARRAYKLLVELHDEYASIIKAITDLGAVERESRNLQDQIDFETLKDTKTKLEKVDRDLDEIRREIDTILKK